MDPHIRVDNNPCRPVSAFGPAGRESRSSTAFAAAGSRSHTFDSEPSIRNFSGTACGRKEAAPEINYGYKIDIPGEPALCFPPSTADFSGVSPNWMEDIDVGANRNSGAEFGEYRNFSLTNHPVGAFPER